MSGIAYLGLAVFFSSGVAMTMKVANAKSLKLGQFLAVNYLVCMLGLLAWFISLSHPGAGSDRTYHHRQPNDMA
jgi:hypothetical protein